MSTFLVIAGLLFITVNLGYFLRNKTYNKSNFSTALFLKLFFVLLGVTIGFAILYYALSIDTVILRISSSTGKPAEESFLNLLYFSGVTILSVGYGDLIPVGPTRFFALLEAAIGVLLPTAYFLKALGSSSSKNDKGQ